MRISVPSEVKNNEGRVALTPPGVHALVDRGHRVFVQRGAGLSSRIPDVDYAAAGATLVETADDAWGAAELLVKVKEPVAEEYRFLRSDLVLFTFLHLAADRALTEALIASRTTAVAYETVQLADGSLPILAPMSEVAGRLSPLVGAHALLGAHGGRGTLLGGVPGTRRANVLIIGGGVAGEHAAANAVGLGAQVTIVDRSLPRLRSLESRFGSSIQTRPSTRYDIASLVEEADLVIGSVLIPGAAAPKLVTDDMVRSMRPGSVLVDIAIDQGGCFEGSRPTTHDEPTFPVHDSRYYCVANMPGAVPETSTAALSNATLPYVSAIADLGWAAAADYDPALAKGLNTVAGRVTNAGVAEALDFAS